MNKYTVVVALMCASMALCFEEDSFLIDDRSSYPHYPHELFEVLTHRVVNPNEQNLSPSSTKTATAFTRPFANKFIKKGESVISLSQEHAIDSARIVEQFPVLSEISYTYVEEPFVLWLILNVKLGAESPHRHFISTLPETIVNPLLFENEEWSSIPADFYSTHFNQLANVDRNTLLQACQSVLKQLRDTNPDVFARLEELIFKEYLWAYVVVKDFIRNTPNGLAIYPALNFAHSPTAFPAAFVDGNIVVVASQDYDIGDQIYINYGNTSNHELLLHHSMYVENNIFDCIYFTVNARNPFWLMVSEPLFGITTSFFESCVKVDFQPSDDIFIKLRTMVASDSDLDNIEQILEGNMISLTNELHALRALLFAIKSQKLSETQEKNDNIAVQFWNDFSVNRVRSMQTVLNRIQELWSLYL